MTGIKYMVLYYEMALFSTIWSAFAGGQSPGLRSTFPCSVSYCPFSPLQLLTGERQGFFSNFSQMLKKGLLSCNHPGAEGCGMRDEVVVGLSLPLPQAGQSLPMELRLPEEFWILLWIPSMRRGGFIPGAKDISLSSRKSHVSRCNTASTRDFPAVCIGLRLFPGQVNSKARNQPITPSTAKHSLPFT